LGPAKTVALVSSLNPIIASRSRIGLDIQINSIAISAAIISVYASPLNDVVDFNTLIETLNLLALLALNLMLLSKQFRHSYLEYLFELLTEIDNQVIIIEVIYFVLKIIHHKFIFLSFSSFNRNLNFSSNTLIIFLKLLNSLVFASFSMSLTV
jgi:hypothetical protein